MDGFVLWLLMRERFMFGFLRGACAVEMLDANRVA